MLEKREGEVGREDKEEPDPEVLDTNLILLPLYSENKVMVTNYYFQWKSKKLMQR